MHYLKYISLVTTLSFYVLVGQNSKDEIWSNENFSGLKFRKTGFSWGNSIPKLHKYIGSTIPGKSLERKLYPWFGAMWIITFEKAF